MLDIYERVDIGPTGSDQCARVNMKIRLGVWLRIRKELGSRFVRETHHAITVILTRSNLPRSPCTIAMCVVKNVNTHMLLDDSGVSLSYNVAFAAACHAKADNKSTPLVLHIYLK
jgi:hypothetical protein